MNFVEFCDSVAQSAFYNTSASSGFDPVIRRVVNEAIAKYAREELYFNEATHLWEIDGTTENPLDLPEYFQTLASLLLYNTDGTTVFSQPLYQVPYETLLQYTANLSRQPPIYFSFFSSSLYIAPLPDIDYTLQLSYYRSWPVLVAHNDTNPWITQGALVIRNHALSVINAEIHHNFDRASFFWNEAERELRSLRSLSSARNSPQGSIQRCF